MVIIKLLSYETFTINFSNEVRKLPLASESIYYRASPLQLCSPCTIVHHHSCLVALCASRPS